MTAMDGVNIGAVRSAWSQLIMAELSNDRSAAEDAAAEAVAATTAAARCSAAGLRVQPHAPHADCVEVAKRARTLVEQVRAESRDAEELFAKAKEKFIESSIHGFINIRHKFQRLQEAQATLRTLSRVVEPRIAAMESRSVGLANGAPVSVSDRQTTIVASAGRSIAAAAVPVPQAELVCKKRRREEPTEQEQTLRQHWTQRPQQQGRPLRESTPQKQNRLLALHERLLSSNSPKWPRGVASQQPLQQDGGDDGSCTLQ